MFIMILYDPEWHVIKGDDFEVSHFSLVNVLGNFQVVLVSECCRDSLQL